MKKKAVLGLLLFVLLIGMFGCTIPGISEPNASGGQTALSSPSNISAKPKDKAVEFSWSPVENANLAGYNVYRSLSSKKNYFKANSSVITEAKYADSGLVNDLVYYYVVTSVGKDGKESAYSSEISVTPSASAGAIEEPVAVEEPEECKEKPSQLQKDLCLMENAVSRGEASLCEMLKELSKDNCYKEVAVELKNSTLCKEITESNISLRNSCFKAVAEASLNDWVCLEIKIEDSNSQEKDDCYYAVAVASNKVFACDFISSSKTKDDCYAEIAADTGNYAVCSNISTTLTSAGFKRDICYDSVLSTQITDSMCALYLDKDARNNCYYTIALSNTSPETCDKIKLDQNVSDNCYFEINKELLELEICKKIVDANMSQTCIDDIAKTSAQIDVCEALTEVAKSDACFYGIAISANDVTLCSRILNDRDLKDDCYAKIALNLEDSRICEKISRINIIKQSECYIDLAVLLLDTRICESIDGSTHYIKCYSKVAEATGDSSVCRQIQVEFSALPYGSSDYCFYNYAIDTNNVYECKNVLNLDFRAVCDANVSS